MHRYTTHKFYSWFNRFISTLNFSMQIILIGFIIDIPISIPLQFLAFIIAYLLTDFINGFIHMVMDNTDNYTSIFGPFIANFHRHHQTPMYTKRPIPIVYFNESGAKIWLVPYLIFVIVLLLGFNMSPMLLHALVYIGILSSVAEISHYLCHTSNSKIVRFLGRYRILLSRQHHELHHQCDNMHYAFLNGVSDSILNWIAKRIYPGYKKTTDLHFAHYSPDDTLKR